ncbi:hypothetical protein Tgr7_0070 [Thioalkalivibrio sulfidiphilus HL-EbGr7]|uniref:Secreted protein n=1 Tax=Thioalkalivibrio sulfidiphilus (strain HL-EbGR7) TaxID=396588 RepID=B8GTB4_THISH|nr:hypothetical protein Tgr7_0070 [Thioalkalivibrio sulfidiphilus HL-EbGr7]
MARFLYAKTRDDMRGNAMRLMILLATSLLMFPAMAQADGRTQDRGAEATQAENVTEAPQRRGRLRFRDGPVCMCSQGMSEEDIQRAERERREQAGRRN